MLISGLNFVLKISKMASLNILEKIMLIVYFNRNYHVFSSAVPPGSGAFQMPTRPSSSASTLRGGRTNLRNASVTFSLFVTYFGMKLLWDDINNIS